MTRKVVACGLLVVGGACGLARAELPRHTARPFALPGIGCHDYKTASAAPNPTVTRLSLTKLATAPDPTPTPTPVLVVGGTTVAVPRTGPQPLLYTMLDPKMQADHCFLTRVAVALHPDGAYQISFRADQNPTPSNDLRSPLPVGDALNTTTQTSHLLRNKFVVTVRGYASYPVAPTVPGRGITPPALVEIPLTPFWVQKGEPRSVLVSETSEAVRRYHGAIDRVEVEFTYK